LHKISDGHYAIRDRAWRPSPEGDAGTFVAKSEDLDPVNPREHLRQAIQTQAIYICPPGQTIPARGSGTWKNLFMLRRITQQGHLLSMITDELEDLIWADAVDPSTVQFAGIETGAIPLVTALALRFSAPSFIVRRQRRDHGLFNQIEGKVDPGRLTVLIDDTLGSGLRMRQCITAIYESKYDILLHHNVYTLLQNQPMGSFVDNEGGTWGARTIFRRHDFTFDYVPVTYWSLPDALRGK
jgi:hypothetical protein